MTAALHAPDLFVELGDVRLAVFQHGNPLNPTVILVHGYPDNHEVWDGVVAQLQNDFHVVTYDVRGSGASSASAGAAELSRAATSAETPKEAENGRDRPMKRMVRGSRAGCKICRFVQLL